MAQSHRVEERRAPVAVHDVHVGAAQRDQRVDTVCVAATGGAVQRCTAAQVNSQIRDAKYGNCRSEVQDGIRVLLFN